jgi:LPXTG-motif cell wall-anchored protein
MALFIESWNLHHYTDFIKVPKGYINSVPDIEFIIDPTGADSYYSDIYSYSDSHVSGNAYLIAKGAVKKVTNDGEDILFSHEIKDQIVKDSDKTPAYFDVCQAGLVIRNVSGRELPNTGGTGTLPFAIAGGAMTALSLVLGLYRYLRKDRECA